NGALRDVVCRGLLLERAGEIALPAVRRRIRGQQRSARLRPEAVLIDTTPVVLRLGALGPVEMQLVRRTADEPLFNSLREQYHYLGYEQPIGENLKYLAWAQGQPVACLAFVSAAPPRAAASLHWMGPAGAAAQHPLARLQHAVSDFAVGRSGS